MRDYGDLEAEKVAVAAKSNLAYFKQLASHHRRPSPELAKRLADASGGRLDVLSLLYPPADETEPTKAKGGDYDEVAA